MLLRIIIAPLGLTIELTAPSLDRWDSPTARRAPERPTLPPNVVSMRRAA